MSKKYRVVFYDLETKTNQSVIVSAKGVVSAIDEAQKAAKNKWGLASLDWEIWKVERTFDNYEREQLAIEAFNRATKK